MERKENESKLSLKEWIQITSALAMALGGIAAGTGHQLFTGGASPDVVVLRQDLQKRIEEDVKIELEIEQIRGRLNLIDDRLNLNSDRDLEHLQGGRKR